MTDSDIRTLKSYLTQCLEPQLKFAELHIEQFTKEEAEAVNPIAAELAAKLRRYYTGQADALRQATYDYKELFEEELKEECSHQWAASYDLDDQIDGFDCVKCGAHQGREG